MSLRNKLRTRGVGLVVALGVIAGVGTFQVTGDVCPCTPGVGPFKAWVMLDSQTLALIDCTTGQVAAAIPMGATCNSITTKPDCTVAFVGTIGNPATGKPPGFCDIDCQTLQIVERPLPAPPIPNGMICKGNQVWIAMQNGQVAVFNCDTGEIRFVTIGGGCNSIIAKCDGSVVFVGTAGVAGVKGPGFCDIDCDTLQVIERPLPVPPNPDAFWWDDVNNKLWMMLQDFSVYVFDCDNGELVACVPVGGGCNSIVGKCDGSTVFVGNVGGIVPQQFFPPIPFGQAGLPQQDFTVDSFFDIEYRIEISEVPGGPTVPMVARGNGAVQRAQPQRDWLSPTSPPATIPIEMVELSLTSVQPVILNGQPYDVQIELAPPPPGQPSGGQVVGSPNLATGDFPAQPVDSFFDIWYRIHFIGPDGTTIPYRALTPTRLELDPEGPPVTQIPFGCDWWRLPPDVPGIAFIQDGVLDPTFPPQIFVGCDRLCFPPPPPPKDPGVCDIPCATFIPTECPLPAPPIRCGLQIRPNSTDVWVAMINGTVGAWDCFWNPITPVPISVGGGCTVAAWKPDGSTFLVGTAGNPNVIPPKPPGICDIDPLTFGVAENPTPGIPLPKGIRICETTAAAPCPCDWNQDGFLNDQDFFDWANDYFTGTGPRGQHDFNNDGFQNDQDWFEFVNCYFTPPASCP